MPRKIIEYMPDKQAKGTDVLEILQLKGWGVRELALYWDCTEATIYQWIRLGLVTRGLPTWAVRKTLEEARAEAGKKRPRKAVPV